MIRVFNVKVKALHLDVGFLYRRNESPADGVRKPISRVWRDFHGALAKILFCRL